MCFPLEGVVLHFKEPISEGLIKLRVEHFDFNSLADSTEFSLVWRDIE